MRIVSQREYFAMHQPWFREADLPQIQGPRPGADKMKGMGNQPNFPAEPQQPDYSNMPWLQHDWKSADFGAFHSPARPAMSSDVPHPSEVLDPNNKKHVSPRVYSVKQKDKSTIRYHLPSWVDSANNSADPERDPWGVMTPYNKVEHISPDGSQVKDISQEFHLGNGNTSEDLTTNHLDHHNNQTPEQAYKGRIWYRGAHEGTKDLSDKTVGDHARVVHTMSAFSPKTEWDENLEKGHHFLTHYDGSGTPPVIPGMQSPVRKAMEIYHAPTEQIADSNNGPKTKAFANNILDATPLREPRPGVDDDTGFYQFGTNPHTGEVDYRTHPDHDSTCDTHDVRMKNTPHGDIEAMRKLKYGTPPHFEAGLTVNGQDIRPGYDLYARVGAEATRRANLQEPDPQRHLIPKQLQAGPWGKFKEDLDFANNKTVTGPGEAPGGLTKQFDMKKNQGRDRAEVEREWAEKNPLNNPIPRYQHEHGDWMDSRRPEVDLRSAPGWGNRAEIGKPRRAMRLVGSTGSPIMDQWLDAAMARYPQHQGGPGLDPHLAHVASAHLSAFDDFDAIMEGQSFPHQQGGGAGYNSPFRGEAAEDLWRGCPHCHAGPQEMHDPHCPVNHTDDPWRDTKALGGPPLRVTDDTMHRLNSVRALLASVDDLTGG